MTATTERSTATPPARPAPAPAAAPRTGGALSVPQMLRLMRAEYDKAQRLKYPIVAMLITVDRLETLGEEEAGAYRQLVMPGVFGLLRAVCRDQNIQGLGCWAGNRQVAIFPHVAPWGVQPLAEELLRRARALVPPDGKHVPGDLTLSIGVAHNQHSGSQSFDYLIEEAETGLVMALQGGGDRFVQWKEVENELADIRGELEDQASRLLEQHKELEEKIQAWYSEANNDLLEKIDGIFDRCGEKTPQIERLQKEMVALAHNEIQREREQALAAQMAEHRRQVDTLERRIAKLTDLLQVTEEELKRVAAMKAVDTGVASIYSTVQGLSGDEANAEVKKEMMAEIFKANLAFQKRGAGDTQA